MDKNSFKKIADEGGLRKSLDLESKGSNFTFHTLDNYGDMLMEGKLTSFGGNQFTKADSEVLYRFENGCWLLVHVHIRSSRGDELFFDPEKNRKGLPDNGFRDENFTINLNPINEEEQDQNIQPSFTIILRDVEVLTCPTLISAIS